MIKIVEGNILEATEDIICHQVNCMGVMGGGLAYQIKEKYPYVYANYRHICKEYLSENHSLLGEVIFGVFTHDNKIIANLCGQSNYGTHIQQTDYAALAKALKIVYKAVNNTNSSLNGYSVAIPYNLGCGLGGGDWNVVYDMINRIFENYDVTIYNFENN